MSAVHLAERATLGALMLADSPDTVGEILRWLRPEDFADPWHREVHKVVRDRAATCRPVNPNAVGIDLLARVGPTRAALVRLIELLRATPTHPDPRSYAVMVLEAALRRETAALGVLLRAGALSAALEGSARPMLATTATVEAGIDAIETRFRTATGDAGPTRQTGPRPIGAVHRTTRPVIEQALGADRLLRAHPRPTRTRLAKLESGLIAAVIARPQSLALVRSWLHHDELTDRGWAAVYRAVLELTDQQRRVDPVTVAWLTRDTPAAPTADALAARVEAALPFDLTHLTRQVAAEHLRHHADHAARTLRLAAEDPTRTLPEVLRGARAATAGLRTASAPLAGHTPATGASPQRTASRRRETVVPQGRTG